MDSETMVVGVMNDAVGQGIGLLKTFLYDVASDDWLQSGKNLKDSSIVSGKVLVTTTQKLDII
jgi:hypothetical protein